MPHRLDTDSHVFFYENEFYMLSNFSAFQLQWHGRVFATSEHAYQWTKFLYEVGADVETHVALSQIGRLQAIRTQIKNARSAHDAFKIAERSSLDVNPRWPDIKLQVMHDILRAKCEQHEYVRRKLDETGNRKLVEDSWRDGFWGSGPDGNGLNHLGRLWMRVRSEQRGAYGSDS